MTTDSDVAATIQELSDYWAQFTDQDDWSSAGVANYNASKLIVDGYAEKMVSSWNISQWATAGQLFTLAAAYVIALPGTFENMDDELAETIELFSK